MYIYRGDTNNDTEIATQKSGNDRCSKRSAVCHRRSAGCRRRSAGCRRRSAGCRRRSAGCRRRSAGCRRRIVFVAAQTIRCHHCHVNPVHSKQAHSSIASGLSRVGGPSIGHNANASSRVDGNGNDGHKVCHLDARYALRRICHSPVFSAISVAIFAALSSQCHVKVNVSVKVNVMSKSMSASKSTMRP